MSLGSPSVLEASAAELKLVVGPQGRTIIALAKRFNVRIDLPKGTSTQLTIHGEQAHAALEAIELLLERNLEHQNDNNSTLASASAPSAHSLPLSSLRSPTSYYMKYQLKAKVPNFDESSIKRWISSHLESLFGVVGGGSVDVDVVMVNLEEHSFVLRTPKDEVLGVQAAIALANHFDKEPCAASLVASAPFLTALAAPSRLAGFAAYSLDNFED